MNSMLTDVKITALYERRFRDIEPAGDSNTIANQKRSPVDCAEQRGFSSCLRYPDDGWRGDCQGYVPRRARISANRLA